MGMGFIISESILGSHVFLINYSFFYLKKTK